MKQIDKQKFMAELTKTVAQLGQVVDAYQKSNTTTKTTTMMGTTKVSEPEVKTLDLENHQHASTILELGKAGWQVVSDEASSKGGRLVTFMRTATMSKTTTANEPLTKSMVVHNTQRDAEIIKHAMAGYSLDSSDTVDGVNHHLKFTRADSDIIGKTTMANFTIREKRSNPVPNPWRKG